MSAKKFPGILVGRHSKLGYLTYRGQQFVALAAPTRSGKGVGIVIPNLLTYPDSVVVLDLKLENFKYTSLFRQKNGQDVFLFAPFSEEGRTHRWNVFDAVKKRPARFHVSEVRSIGQTFWSSRVDAKTKFWNDLARNLFVGLALYLLQTPELPCTLGEILRQSSGKGKPVKEHIKKILETRSKPDGNLPALSLQCRDALQRFMNQSDNVIGNILSTFTAPLQIFDDPVVDAATSASDFDFDNVRKKRTSIYFGVQPDKLEDAPELINLFFSQLIKLNLREQAADNPDLKYQCLLVLDEFAAIGRVGIIAAGSAFIASYNLRLLTIFQSISQLEDDVLYGKHGTRSLLTNHGMQILYPPREQDDAEAYERTLGYFTMVSKSKGRSRGGRSSTRTDNESDQKRALMMAQELKELPKSQEIITLENCKPILCEKAFFYSDPLFIDRLKSVSPSLKALGERIPNQVQLEDAALVRGELSIEVPEVDIEAFFNASSGLAAPGTASVATDIRSVQEGEMDFLQAADITNQDEIVQALCQLMPSFNEVMAIVNIKEAVEA
ncbi:type IV secretory system conjugative DNA transfer family protein [Paraburkholderia susongensis]|uniref:Type IV secretion system protein VirD4 n=1 Tax=Paraburkholderia susongensis TaxID=1515439 RepID=A0A1X7M5T6_9BURK|nr:type IV secretory system conjugative DNA transfer family protein [Paraburkholderia susongensis]SMG61556.1 type IV secretion system protein VirD4 [Paraburkholderia susongensis]